MKSKMKQILSLAFLFMACQLTFGQHIGMTFQDAQKKGISMPHLDSLYKSAVHSDTSLAVFKTDLEQKALIQAYYKLLQDFSKFLSEGNFTWDKQTKVFNKVYFNTDGSIDFFLYNFMYMNVKTDDQLSAEKQNEFNRLLNLFILDYKIPMTAKTKFSQCGPSLYKP